MLSFVLEYINLDVNQHKRSQTYFLSLIGVDLKQCCSIRVYEIMEMFYIRLSNIVANSNIWRLNPWDVSGAMEGLNCVFN